MIQKFAILLIIIQGAIANPYLSQFGLHFGPHFMDNHEDLPDGNPATPSTIINTGIRFYKELNQDLFRVKPGLGLSYYRAGYGNERNTFGFNNDPINGFILDKPHGSRVLIETYDLDLIADFTLHPGSNEINIGLLYTIPLFGSTTIYNLEETAIYNSESIGLWGATEKGYEYNAMAYFRIGYKYYFSKKYGVGFEFNKGLTNFLSYNGNDVGNSTKNAFNLTFEYKL